MTALQQAMAQAGIVASNYKFFDLFDTLDDKLMDGELKSRVFASLAWVCDMQAINAARGVFYETYVEETEVNTIDAFNEFVVNCAEIAANDQHGREIGFSGSNSWGKLMQLLRLRVDLHDQAGRYATRRYDPKSLSAIMANERQQQISNIDRQKVEAMAEAMADGDDELKKLMVEQLLLVHGERFQKSFETRRKTAPAIMGVITRAQHLLKVDAHGQYEHMAFHDLDETIQINFIEQAVKAVDRALADMAVMRSITVPEYAVYLKEGAMIKRELGTVLKAPKYTANDSHEFEGKR